MIITKLRLRNFRNILEEEVPFSKGVNVICGANAQGKTNLLEGVAFMSTGKSFRGCRDSELICHDQEYAYLKATYQEGDIPLEFEGLIEKKAKSIKIDHKPIKKLSDILGHVQCVVFSPDDLRLLKDSPQLRRRFLDIEISKIKTSYYFDLLTYNKNLQQKNVLLRCNRQREEIVSLVEVYNRELALYANRIVRRRRIFIGELNNTLTDIYQHISNTKERIYIRYKPCCEEEDVAEKLFAKYQQNFVSECEMRTTLYGTHREDFIVTIDERDAKFYASQGQQRTLIAALKLGVSALVEKFAKKVPLILLDDVFSELDLSRQRGLIDCFSNNQLIITTAQEDFSCFSQPNVITIKNGKIVL